MATLPGSMIEIGLDGPPLGRVAPHRPACRLWGNGVRYSGSVAEYPDGSWVFRPAGPPLRSDLVSARRLEMELRSDARWRRRLRLSPFPIHDFAVDLAAQQIRFRPLRLHEEEARLFRAPDAIPVAVTGESLLDRMLLGVVEALTPYEVLATVQDAERLLLPGAIVRLAASRPWSAPFTLDGRVAFLARGQEETRLYLRLADRRSVEEASLLACCECPQFGAHTMWTYGLATHGLARLVRIHHAASAIEMFDVLELRRAAYQFNGQGVSENDWRAWSDSLDETSIHILLSLGTRPVATARVVINDGDRSRSELESTVELPDFLWAGAFVEVSRMAIHPAFRGVGLRWPLFREIGRLARSLGCRFVVFEDRVPVAQKLGAVPLECAGRSADGAEVRLLSIDLGGKGRWEQIERALAAEQARVSR